MDLLKLKKLLGNEDTLDRINQLLVDQRNKPKTYKSKPAHKPSVLGSKCSRKIYYSYYRVEEDSTPTADGIRIMETGNKMEEMIMGWLMAIGEHIPFRNKTDGQIRKGFDGQPDPQFIVKSKKWRISWGKIDNIGRDSEGLWVYEIKSVNENKWRQLKKGPISDHLIQNSIYLQCFNDMYLSGEFDHIPELVGRGKAIGIKLLYVNRNNSQILVFKFKTEQLIQLILDIDRKILKENKYIDTFTLPPKTPEFCQYCSFKNKCDKDWNGIEQKPVDVSEGSDKL